MKGFTRDEPQDLPPEYCQYRDEGCALAPSCLNCPFPRCAYEEPGGVSQKRKRLRNSEVLRLHQEGVSPQELAQSFGVSKRTIYRILRRSNHDGD
ncbi:MAG TPA: helix-turn-helix domain-containing protein [Dehalococcoidia bacterium]|nr:helix-turn-helix domain-containing protein [Dehalococcoidia bacterium]